MFTSEVLFFAYAYVLLGSAAILWVITRDGTDVLQPTGEGMPSTRHVVLLGVSIVALTAGSSFEYRTLIGVVLFAEMFFDLYTFSKAEDLLKEGKTPAKQSRWWIITSACAWIALPSVLFFA